MSSSTSSFRAELKVVAVVLLVLAGSEILLRFTEPWLSLDVKHIQQIPAISESLVAGKGERILFLGNSEVRAGIDPNIIEEELRNQGIAPVHIERVFPDATQLPEWDRAFKHYFINKARLPEVLVLCFSDSALQDNNAVDPTRLGHYYSSAGEMPEILGQEMRGFESRAEFVLASLSFSYANRMRVRTRAMDMVVPGYRDSAQRINRGMKRSHSQAAAAQNTYNRLSRFLSLAREQGVRVIVVAMPISSPYPLDPQIKSTVETAGMSFLDCRNVDGISAQSFVDEIHLASSGMRVYSRFLGRELAAPIGKGPTRDNLTSDARQLIR
jgi:hypothetical protein